jgi:hypothetical protein
MHGTTCKTGEARPQARLGFSRSQNRYNQKFGFLVSETCDYTNFYRMDGKGGLGTVFDILTNCRSAA